MNINDPIIIVDDDDDDHYFFKRVCEKLNVQRQILFFTEGEKALKYLTTTTVKPFLILCDINMPRMNGLEVRRRIFENATLRKKSIPFIFFSTSATPSLLNEAYAMNVQGFFIKEQSLDKMEKTLKAIFDYWDKCERPV